MLKGYSCYLNEVISGLFNRISKDEVNNDWLLYLFHCSSFKNENALCNLQKFVIRKKYSAVETASWNTTLQGLLSKTSTLPISKLHPCKGKLVTASSSPGMSQKPWLLQYYVCSLYFCVWLGKLRLSYCALFSFSFSLPCSYVYTTVSIMNSDVGHASAIPT